MARKKQPDLGNLFSKTDTGQRGDSDIRTRLDSIDLNQGNIRATGVGLRGGEIEALDVIGAHVGELIDPNGGPVARNALIRIAARRLIEAYQSGALRPADLADYFTQPEKPKPKLNL